MDPTVRTPYRYVRAHLESFPSIRKGNVRRGPGWGHKFFTYIAPLVTPGTRVLLSFPSLSNASRVPFSFLGGVLSTSSLSRPTGRATQGVTHRRPCPLGTWS